MDYTNLDKIVAKTFSDTTVQERQTVEDVVSLLSLYEYFELGYDGICSIAVFESEADPSDYDYIKARLADMYTRHNSGLNDLETLGNIFGGLMGQMMTGATSSNPIAERNYQRSKRICRNAMDNYGSAFTDVLDDVQKFITEFKSKYV